MMHRQCLTRLAALASMKADVDLAALAAVAARKKKIEGLRTEVEVGLAQEADVVRRRGALVGFRVLEGHMVFANNMLDRLGAEVTRLEAERLQRRDLAATSFGRASVLSDLSAAIGKGLTAP